MDGDHGHRFGNFPNYYFFHPPSNRIDVLRRSGILDYICRGLYHELKLASMKASSTFDLHDTSLTVDFHKDKNLSIQFSKALRNFRNILDIYYCDLGCNEGDLTMAMASLLSNIDFSSCRRKSATSKSDRRTQSYEQTACTLESSDLDISVSEQVRVHCLGLDLDSMLIQRARLKYSSFIDEIGSNKTYERLHKEEVYSSESVVPRFKVANLCSEMEHTEACFSFMTTTFNTHDQNRCSSHYIKPETNCKPVQMFHLCTIFSTTMWIHIHSGDAGLKSFLERACSWTRTFLLIEPQPSVCYRKAKSRLRKMGHQEFNDVSFSRLKFRSCIEREIENIVVQFGFQRILFNDLPSEVISDMQSVNVEKNPDAVTEWNRTLQLYKRKS